MHQIKMVALLDDWHRIRDAIRGAIGATILTIAGTWHDKYIHLREGETRGARRPNQPEGGRDSKQRHSKQEASRPRDPEAEHQQPSTAASSSRQGRDARGGAQMDMDE